MYLEKTKRLIIWNGGCSIHARECCYFHMIFFFKYDFASQHFGVSLCMDELICVKFRKISSYKSVFFLNYIMAKVYISVAVFIA